MNFSANASFATAPSPLAGEGFAALGVLHRRERGLLLGTPPHPAPLRDATLSHKGRGEDQSSAPTSTRGVLP